MRRKILTGDFGQGQADASSLKAPTTYAEWTDLLAQLKRKEDDSEVLQAMQSGSLAWQSGVAERFTQTLIDTVNFRLNQAVDKFQKELSHSHGEERIIVQNLIVLKREYHFLYQLMDLPVLPADVRSKLTQIVRDQADQNQQSLEQSSHWDRTGKLYQLIKNNPVNNLEEQS